MKSSETPCKHASKATKQDELFEEETAMYASSLSLAALAALVTSAGAVAPKQVKGNELRSLVAGATIGSDPARSSLETFSLDGKYRHLYRHGTEDGTYLIERDMVCVVTNQKICRKILRNGKRELFFSYESSSESSYWPMRIISRQKGDAK